MYFIIVYGREVPVLWNVLVYQEIGVLILSKPSVNIGMRKVEAL